MPNRILRDGILRSKRVNALSRDAELFYRRLMSAVDDYGRCEADPAVLRADVFPRKVDEVTEQNVSEWLAECTAGDDPLVVVYEIQRHKYLQIFNFKQRERREKFPPPPAMAGNGAPSADNGTLSAANGGSRDEYSLSPPPPPPNTTPNTPPRPTASGGPSNDTGFDFRAHFEQLVSEYPPEALDPPEIAYWIFLGVIVKEHDRRKIPHAEIFSEILAAVRRWREIDFRWRSGRVHSMTNFLEKWWRMKPRPVAPTKSTRIPSDAIENKALVDSVSLEPTDEKKADASH